MTPEDLAALGQGTTPGPWRVGARRLCDVETSAGALVADCGVGVADARLVAAAPELLAEVERLRGIVHMLRERAGVHMRDAEKRASGRERPDYDSQGYSRAMRVVLSWLDSAAETASTGGDCDGPGVTP
jgi:hypothetical protein